MFNAFELQEWKPTKTLLHQYLDLATNNFSGLNSAAQFCLMIGCSAHMTNRVRLNIAFTVGYLSWFIHKPAEMLDNEGKQFYGI